MKEFETYITRLQRMDELIRTGSTGTPKEFASKLGVCERTFFEYLSFFKDIVGKYNVSVLYNDIQQTYEYNRSGRLKITFKWIEE